MIDIVDIKNNLNVFMICIVVFTKIDIFSIHSRRTRKNLIKQI